MLLYICYVKTEFDSFLFSDYSQCAIFMQTPSLREKIAKPNIFGNGSKEYGSVGCKAARKNDDLSLRAVGLSFH